MSSTLQTQEPRATGLLALALALSDAVTRGGELSVMLRTCAEEMVHHLRLPLVRIWTCTGDVLELAASAGLIHGAETSVSRIPVGRYTIGRVAASGQRYLASDVGRDFESADPAECAEPVRAFAGYPLRVEGRVVGVLGLFAGAPIRGRVLAVVDPMAAVIAQAIERKRVEAELRGAIRLHGSVEDRLAIIAEASGALLESLDLSAVLERVVGLSRQVLAADAYALWHGKPSGEWGILLATGLSEEYRRNIIASSRFSDDLPGTPVVAEDVDTLPLVEHRREMYRAEGIRSLLVFPLQIRGKNSATLTLYFRTPQQFRPEHVRIGSALANLAAAAIGSAEAWDDQRRLREEAQETTRRMAFSAEASRLLATTLDYQHTLREVAHLAIPAFADWCAVDMLAADGRILRLATVHADPARLALAEEYYRRFPTGADDPTGVSAVIRNNKAVLAAEIPEGVLEESIKDPEQLRILRELKLRSVILVPMAARGRVLGAITFVTAESERHYGSEDLAVAEQVAYRAALAIDNALLYSAAQERHVEAKRALDALRASHQRLEQFAYAAGHDLREPLRTITAHLKLVEKKAQGALDGSAKEHMDLVVGAATRMQRLLDDLLDYVRLGSGAATRVLFSLTEAARRAVENLALTIAEAQAQVLIGELPRISGDETQFVRLFQNLIANAVKYKSAEPPLIRIAAERRSSDWLISVDDNGVGIDREQHERIFGLFKRLHGYDIPGTGIGLAIARAVMENHGGRIWVESQPGQGASFKFTVPAADPES